MSDSPTIRNHAAFIWSVADLLRGDYKQSEYGRVILPLVVLRRLDCVLEPTKAQVLQRHTALTGRIENIEPVLQAVAGQQFFNTSPLDFRRLLDDPANIADNLRAYIAAFSLGARDVIEKFDLAAQITKLDRANLLFLVISKFADIDLHPEAVSNVEMGYLYEELIRRFSELSNETAGEHFTPREVIRLMVNLLFIEDEKVLATAGTVRTLFDPACGTGGMLSVAEDHLRQLNSAARLEVFGQELNAETYAICRSDMMLKGQDASHIAWGNSFSEDGHPGSRFDYLLANPPFGVEWKKVEDIVKNEAESKGFAGRFGAGTPRINDGSFLFLQHMISKMKPVSEGGSRVAIVFNGSPLFTGAAGSGESEIRRWIIENDMLEAVVALPDQMFYNTGISTYVWILTNDKADADRGLVRLIDARESGTKMRKSLGDKRKELTPNAIEEIAQLYGGALGESADDPRVKVLANEAFGFQRITVERPLRRRWEVTPEALLALTATKPWLAWKGRPSVEPVEITDAFAPLVGPRFATASALTAAIKKQDATTPLPVVRELVKLAAIADADAPIIKGKAGPESDPDLRDAENIPLPAGWLALDDKARGKALVDSAEAHLKAEIHPYVPDAWIDHTKTKVGFEIPFTRQFYVYTPPRPVAEIAAEIKDLESQIQDWMNGLGL